MKITWLRNMTCCVAAFAGVAAAQNMNKFAFNVGGGFTEPVVHTEHRANTGFNITAGAGWKFTPQFGISAEFGYNRLNLSDSILTAAGVPGMQLYHLVGRDTANPDHPARTTFTLQFAPAVNVPFTNVPGATSPWTNALLPLQGYFRLNLSQ